MEHILRERYPDTNGRLLCGVSGCVFKQPQSFLRVSHNLLSHRLCVDLLCVECMERDLR